MSRIKNWVDWIRGANSKKKQSIIDESSEESFPASDPPAWAAEHEIKKHTEGPSLGLSGSFHQQIQKQFSVAGAEYHYYSLPAAEGAGLHGLSRLPFTLKVLLENLLRHFDGDTVTAEDLQAVIDWLKYKTSDREIAYRPARILMQDFTGVPAIVDLAAMRAAMQQLGGDPEKINPLSTVDLIIDHSIQVDEFMGAAAFTINAKLEMERNQERYAFLRWGQKAFQNFRVVPPDMGICHQVNLEHLAKAVWCQEKDGKRYAYPDTLVGTDSHTTMINGLGTLGWGVGGIEAEAAMLGQPISMLVPEVIGVKVIGKLAVGTTATDLVLYAAHLLRKKGVVGKFVEFFGEGLGHLSIADRATIANMAPEYGATCGFFPLDQAALDYLTLTGRGAQTIALVETYAKAQGLWHSPDMAPPVFTDHVVLDLSKVTSCLAGPKRPQDWVALADLGETFDQCLREQNRFAESKTAFKTGADYALHHGDIVIAAITSCTNTSNPNVMIAAGLLAKKAIQKGLKRKPWVKTSFAPGSQVVTRYLEKAQLQPYLDEMGFTLVGYGCTTCIGNSGPLLPMVEQCINENDLVVSSILSGNRNFEGRIHPLVKTNWLASPPLVVAFALTGTVRIDLTQEPLGLGPTGTPIYLKDLWPSPDEIAREVATINGEMFNEVYQNIFVGTQEWQGLPCSDASIYPWQPGSTYIQAPPFFDDMDKPIERPQDIRQARILAMFGDSITTDHISPAGAIQPDSPAGIYLRSQGVAVKDFNSYGARRGNHHVMVRGTFANVRIKNEIVPDIEGGSTRHFPSGDILTIYGAAMRYQTEQVPLVVIAGKEYGTGSSRDWAAKGPKLQGVVAVIAESFERIHRSNLVGMGILPLQFPAGVTRKTLKLDGSERLDLLLPGPLGGRLPVKVMVYPQDKAPLELDCIVRIDTPNEWNYYKHGGTLRYVLRRMLSGTGAFHESE